MKDKAGQHDNEEPPLHLEDEDALYGWSEPHLEETLSQLTVDWSRPLTMVEQEDQLELCRETQRKLYKQKKAKLAAQAAAEDRLVTHTRTCHRELLSHRPQARIVPVVMELDSPPLDDTQLHSSIPRSEAELHALTLSLHARQRIRTMKLRSLSPPPLSEQLPPATPPTVRVCTVPPAVVLELDKTSLPKVTDPPRWGPMLDDADIYAHETHYSNNLPMRVKKGLSFQTTPPLRPIERDQAQKALAHKSKTRRRLELQQLEQALRMRETRKELIQRAGSLTLDPVAMAAAEEHLDVEESTAALSALLALEDNEHCADCQALHPKWAIITHGGFICTQCAGVHRSLGVHISFVLSCTLDKWTPLQLAALVAGGNTKLNERLEFSVPESFRKPHADALREDRAAYIHTKYVDQAFRMGPNKRRQEAILASPSTPLEVAVSSHGSCGMVEYVGIVTIELVEGSTLAAMDVNGSSDPYVSFRLGDQVVSSHTVKHSLNPVWKETLRLSWDGASPLVVQVYSYNKLQPDRKMGVAVVDCDRLQQLDTDKPLDLWILTTMPREWPQNFGDHMVAAGEGFTKGVVSGITGIVMDPIRGAKRNGWGGFAKGVGLGMAGGGGWRARWSAPSKASGL
ncbi:hypothetical protein DYB30_002238 [Aphanomyces astaci]|uniref:Arf-GAP domain-containing protein n=1 Tax=Aphanomyces astaci TaxID=112090 RepID=A0A397DZZ6_APHAT|nr:hypothetical protein DYB30_002238 [Aphanomyces astaci]